MKQNVSPVVAVIAIVALVGIAAFGWMRFAGVSHDGKPPPTMPPEVAKQWAQFTSGSGQAGHGNGGSIPTGQAGPTPTTPHAGPGGGPAGMTGPGGMSIPNGPGMSGPPGGMPGMSGPPPGMGGMPHQ